ncbi:hypothetical protein BUE80_DR006843 [Diplocarpon rosae]|nr:hypothetical protein BUE80_DR006843 [Diplocarpon rosae]
MIFSKLLPYGYLLATAASQDTSGSDVLVLSGVPRETVPTGEYITYTTTVTRPSISAITTSPLVSTIVSGSITRTTTLGFTTLFGIGTSIMAAGNGTGTSTSSPKPQLLLTGRPRTTMSANGTMSGTSGSTTSSAPQPTNTTPCNNYPEFCSRKYGEITEVAAHNSPFVKAGNAGANQQLDVTTQLDDGIRLLQGQMHFVNDTPHFCHSTCDLLDAGPITDYLGKVYDWVHSHPYDVVTLLLGNGAYNAANQTAVPYILDEFSQMWETPFDPVDPAFPCTVQRPPDLKEADAKNRLYLFNHNLNYDINLLGNSILVPQIPLLNATNAVNGTGALGTNTQACVNMWGSAPKFLNVDYYNVGNGSVFEVAAHFNNVTYTRECCGLPVSAAVRVARTSWLAAACVAAVGWLLL